MLSFQTIDPDTLELLKFLSAQPELRRTRLVGGMDNGWIVSARAISVLIPTIDFMQK